MKGFEDSVAHDVLIETLKKCGYNFQEYLLSPSNFGIPNSRLRYYIIAKLNSSKFPFPVTNEVCDDPFFVICKTKINFTQYTYCCVHKKNLLKIFLALL